MPATKRLRGVRVKADTLGCRIELKRGIDVYVDTCGPDLARTGISRTTGVCVPNGLSLGSHQEARAPARRTIYVLRWRYDVFSHGLKLSGRLLRSLEALTIYPRDAAVPNLITVLGSSSVPPSRGLN